MFKLIVFALLFIGLITSVYLVSQKTKISPKASIDGAAKNITVSNISDSSFTVSWITEKPIIGYIKYSADNSFNQTEYDIRDAGDPKLTTTHYVVLKNLQPQTAYSLKIGEKSLQQSTGPVSENTPPVPVLTYGTLKNKTGEIIKGAIVYLKLPDSTTLSTLTTDGNWLITVTNARTADLASYINVADGDMGEVWVDGGVGESMKVTKIKINSNESLGLIIDESVPVAVQPENTALPVPVADEPRSLTTPVPAAAQSSAQPVQPENTPLPADVATSSKEAPSEGSLPPKSRTEKEIVRGDAEEGSQRMTAASETSEDVRRDTEAAGPRAQDDRSTKSDESATTIRSKPTVNPINIESQPEVSPTWIDNILNWIQNILPN